LQDAVFLLQDDDFKDHEIFRNKIFKSKEFKSFAQQLEDEISSFGDVDDDLLLRASSSQGNEYWHHKVDLKKSK
jgi:hypothetical protein